MERGIFMKKALKFSGIIAAVLAVVTFILLLATPGVYAKTSGLGGDTIQNVDGVLVLFGGHRSAYGGWVETTYHASAVSLIAWILILVAMIILLAGFILPLLKVKALDKFAGILNLIAVCALVTAGILLFFSVPVFYQANKDGAIGVYNQDAYHLGAGWIIGAILSIVAGAIAILPAAMDFIGKKK